jgi:hypothetical protein
MDSDGLTQMGVLNLARSREIAYVRSLRPICEMIYSVMLEGFIDALNAYWQVSLEKQKSSGRPRESTPAWTQALSVAKTALSTAIAAADMARHFGDFTRAQEMSVEAWNQVSEAVNLAPQTIRRKYDLTKGLSLEAIEDA